jgi:hypothetical protein
LEKADDAGIVDLDARAANRADGDRQGETLQEREVDVDVEPLCLETGEAVGDVFGSETARLHSLERSISTIEGPQRSTIARSTPAGMRQTACFTAAPRAMPWMKPAAAFRAILLPNLGGPPDPY